MTRTARAVLVKIPVEMRQFTRIRMTRLSVMCMLMNFFNEETVACLQVLTGRC